VDSRGHQEYFQERKLDIGQSRDHFQKEKGVSLEPFARKAPKEEEEKGLRRGGGNGPNFGTKGRGG